MARHAAARRRVHLPGAAHQLGRHRVRLGLAGRPRPRGRAAAATVLFLVVERFAPEPLIPLRLFRDSVFTVTSLVGAVVGIALFGAASYLPTFLQMVEGASATESGLLMLPLMGGIVVASVVSGQLISRTGRYKAYPVAGAAVATLGMWLLSRMDTDTPRLQHSLWQAVLGTGIGLIMPVLVLAVQNSVRSADLGTATSAHNYFRQIGGSVGAAVFGTLFAARLDDALAERLPRDGAGALPPAESVTPQSVHALPPALRDAFVQAYADAMPRIFLYLVPVLALGLVLAFFLKEKPLVSHHTPAAEATTPIPPARTAPPVSGVPVCGHVQHPDGSCVPRAALTLIDVTGRQIGRGASGEDGRYALSVPGAGAYVLIAAAGGHQPQAVSVTVGDRPVELDVVLGGAGRLAGTVVTADGTPVGDAAVTLTDVRGEVVASTRSGREGGYVIGELVAGEYTLAASAPAFRPAALPVTVQSSRETRQDIELAGGAVLRGTVRAGAGRPVEDARVTLLDAAGNVVDTLTTGPDGTFRFVDLSSGEYTVIAAGYPRSPPSSRSPAAAARNATSNWATRTERRGGLGAGSLRAAPGPPGLAWRAPFRGRPCGVSVAPVSRGAGGAGLSGGGAGRADGPGRLDGLRRLDRLRRLRSSWGRRPCGAHAVWGGCGARFAGRGWRRSGGRRRRAGRRARPPHGRPPPESSSRAMRRRRLPPGRRPLRGPSFRRGCRSRPRRPACRFGQLSSAACVCSSHPRGAGGAGLSGGLPGALSPRPPARRPAGRASLRDGRCTAPHRAGGARQHGWLGG
ncbi:MFS transporter [Streptomyces sp. SBR177]